MLARSLYNYATDHSEANTIKVPHFPDKRALIRFAHTERLDNDVGNTVGVDFRIQIMAVTMRQIRIVRLRFLFLSAIIFITACADREDRAPTADELIDLRVMTFNIEWGGTNVSFDKVVEAVRRSGADIVGIQEAEGNLEHLATELGWHYNLRNYVISKFPLVEPQGANGNYVFVEVSPGKVVALANVHLPSDPYGADRIRDGQALEEVLALERTTRLPMLQPYLEILPTLIERGIPVFLTGDFNAPSHQDWTEAAVGTRPFLLFTVDWPVSRAVTDAGFKDSWREMHLDPVADPGLTWWAGRPPLESYTPGDNDPQDRIDFVWYAGQAEVRESIIVGEEGRADVSIGVTPWPSDHRGVVSTFSVIPADMPVVLGLGKRVYRTDEDVEIIFQGGSQQTMAVITGLASDDAKLTSTEYSIRSGTRNRLAASSFGPGHYQISVSGQDGNELQNEFWILDGDREAAIEVVGDSFAVGQAIPIVWNNAPGNRNDYVAVYLPGSTAQYETGDYEIGLPWAYIDALPQGRSQLDESNAGWGWPVLPGTYVMRLMKDDGYDILAESASFEVLLANAGSASDTQSIERSVQMTQTSLSTGSRSLLLVAFGDSTTATSGWTPSIKEVYAQCLPKTLAEHGIRAEVINAGIGNTTTLDGRERLDADVRSHAPDIVIIQFGINDSWIDADYGQTKPRLTRDAFRDNLHYFIDTLRKDGADIILMTPNPMRWSDPYYVDVFRKYPGFLDTNQERGINALLVLYAQDVRDVAKDKDVALIDVFKVFEDYDNQPGKSINDLLVAGDGIHPNTEGQHIVCELLTAQIVGK
ncbi:MAG: lysophospholipase L1-like esterase/endonuclease/exonuclease [Rhodothermales bacterium]